MKNKWLYIISIILAGAVTVGVGYGIANGQSRGQPGAPDEPQAPQAALNSFTYQGALKKGEAGVDGDCQMAFRLYGSQAGTDMIGTPMTTTVTVEKGLFAQKLSFGSGAFDGMPRWLEVKVKCAGEDGYTSLERQEINAAPYALSVPWSGISGKPGRIVIVAKSGGDFNNISAALDSISDASETLHYLVKVMPGVYNERVTMKPFVDIEGSGELSTKITYTGSTDLFTGTVIGADHAELRFLSVENTGGGDIESAVAIFNGSASPTLTHITASASGLYDNRAVFNNYSTPVITEATINASGGNKSSGIYNLSSPAKVTRTSISVSDGMTNIGIENGSGSHATLMYVAVEVDGGNTNIGVSNDSSVPTMRNVTVDTKGGQYNYAVSNARSSVLITDSLLKASDGVNNYGLYNFYLEGTTLYEVKVDRSTIEGGTNSIFNDLYFRTYVGDSQLKGGAVDNNWMLTCVGVYGGTYAALSNLCQ